MARGVFISYRRDDAAHVAGRIADAMALSIGRENVFVDVDSVAPGEDFVRKIEMTIGEAELFLAVIGARWLSAATPQGQRRIDLEGDFIRLEVRSALAAGLKVVPVLVDGAVMPRSEDLPEDIRQLVRHNAVFINHTTFARDMQALLDQLYPDRARRPRTALAALALPLGAGVLTLGVLAAGVWPKGPVAPADLSVSVSLDEQPTHPERKITQTAFVAERGADGALSIRAELPYRDRMRAEKRIDGIAFNTGSPLTAPMPTLLVQVTNRRSEPVVISEVQFEVITAQPDVSALPLLRERAYDYRVVTLFNDGWGEIKNPRLTIRAWGLPETDGEVAAKPWKGAVSLEPCASPSNLVEASIVVGGQKVGDTSTVFDLAGRIPSAFDGKAFVCAVGELSYGLDSAPQTLAIRTRVSNKRPTSNVASPAISLYDLYLDPARQGYVAVVPVSREVPPGASVAIPVRVRSDRSSRFLIRQLVRTAAGETVPGEQLQLELFASRNSNMRGMLDEQRRLAAPADLIASFDPNGLILAATYDPQDHEAAMFQVRAELDAAGCKSFIETVARPIMARLGRAASAVRAVGPGMMVCPRP